MGRVKPSGVAVFRMAVAVTVLGMIGVALAVLIGFEEAPDGLFVISAIGVFAAPVALLLHLWVTRTMTRRQKQAWLRALTGRRALRAVSAYLARYERMNAAP